MRVEKWGVWARSERKDRMATGPFNDSSLISGDISYAWIRGAVTPDRTGGLGGVMSPVGSTAQVECEPIAFDDLNIGRAGSAANLTMTFNAVTVEGEAVLARWRERVGGEMTRLAVSRLEMIGAHHAWRPAMPVTQFAVTKR